MSSVRLSDLSAGSGVIESQPSGFLARLLSDVREWLVTQGLWWGASTVTHAVVLVVRDEEGVVEAAARLADELKGAGVRTRR